MRYRVLHEDLDERTVELEIRSLRKLPSLLELLTVVPDNTVPIDIELPNLNIWVIKYQPKDPETYDQKLSSFADSYAETKTEVLSFLEYRRKKEAVIETTSIVLSGIAVCASVYVFYKSFIKEE